MHDVPAERLISTAQLLDLIEQDTGRRLLPGTIWSYVRRIQMPAPVERRRGVEAQWDLAQVQAWLQQRRPGASRGQAVGEQQDRIRAAVDDLHTAVQAALDAGLSWAEIAAAHPPGPRGPLTKQAVQLRYKHLPRKKKATGAERWRTQ